MIQLVDCWLIHLFWNVKAKTNRQIYAYLVFVNIFFPTSSKIYKLLDWQLTITTWVFRENKIRDNISRPMSYLRNYYLIIYFIVCHCTTLTNRQTDILSYPQRSIVKSHHHLADPVSSDQFSSGQPVDSLMHCKHKQNFTKCPNSAKHISPGW